MTDTSNILSKRLSKVLDRKASCWQCNFVRFRKWAGKVRLQSCRTALKVEYRLLTVVAAGWAKVGRAAEPLSVWLACQDEGADCDLCQFVAVKVRLYLLRLLVLGYEALIVVNERRHLLLICQQRLLHVSDVSQQLDSHGEQLGFVPLNSESIGNGLDAGEG